MNYSIDVMSIYEFCSNKNSYEIWLNFYLKVWKNYWALISCFRGNSNDKMNYEIKTIIETYKIECFISESYANLFRLI